MSQISIGQSSHLPVVFERDGEVFASSANVATIFEKQHGHVLRDIDNLLKSDISPKLEGSWFRPSIVLDSYGREQPAFDLTRDGFTLLAMGFTGAKALAFKVRYIEAFNEMEATLKALPAPDRPLTHRDIGGIVKAVLAKQVGPLQEQLDKMAAENAILQQQVRTLLVEHDPRIAAVTHQPMLTILIDEGVPQKGRGHLSRRLSGRASRWLLAAGRGGEIRISRETERKLFSADGVRDWMRAEGRRLIAEHKASLEGQGVLKFKKLKAVDTAQHSAS